MNKVLSRAQLKFSPIFSLLLIGSLSVLALLFVIVGFGAASNIAIEVEAAITNSQISSDSSASGGQFVTFADTGSGGKVVPLPPAPSGPSSVSRPGYPFGDRVNCSTKEPVCVFGWQEGDVYAGTRNGAYSAKVEWRNITTNAIIKTVNLPDLPNAPHNAARSYPIYNPDNDNWFVVYHASRKGGAGGSNETSIYGALFDKSGNSQGDVVEVYDGNFSGWVPHGYYDTSSKLFYMEWHQQTSSANGRKDITASLVDGATGQLVQSGVKVHDTPEKLEEYSGSAFNPNRGEGLSFFSRNTGGCDESCLTVPAVDRYKTSRSGLDVLASPITINDNTSNFEWRISLAFNPTTDRYIAVYGQGGAHYRNDSQDNMKMHILDADGNSVSGELDLGSAGGGGYWQSGSACSTTTNICLVTFKGQARYIDTTKTDAAAIGASFSLPVGGGTSKPAYQLATDQFVIYGSDAYSIIKGS